LIEVYVLTAQTVRWRSQSLRSSCFVADEISKATPFSFAPRRQAGLFDMTTEMGSKSGYPVRGSGENFSLTEARSIVADLFTANERIYWIDFLLTISLGHLFFALTRLTFSLPLESIASKLAIAAIAFSVQCACFYRAVMFVHEIVHLPEKKLRAFRVIWNLLCGIPFMVPSFTYYSHLDHHRRKMFGTEHDGEYLPLANLSPWWIVIYLTQCLWVPPLAVIRFGILTPLAWLSPALRRLIHQRASSLVMDPSYIRPLPTKTALRFIRLQELGCFLFLIACLIVPIVVRRWPIPFVAQTYATAVVLILMNSLRTLASHRWASGGQEGTFVDQMLDSVTMDNESPWAILINPVGLRYHATHHLFPSMPYHNMRTAHKRLLARLPEDSPYRRTVGSSIWPIIGQLWRAAALNQQMDPNQAPPATSELETVRHRLAA
jgi:fatty acid desaturase